MSRSVPTLYHVSVFRRSLIQRVLSAYVESVFGVFGAENPEWSGDKL